MSHPINLDSPDIQRLVSESVFSVLSESATRRQLSVRISGELLAHPGLFTLAERHEVNRSLRAAGTSLNEAVDLGAFAGKFKDKAAAAITKLGGMVKTVMDVVEKIAAEIRNAVSSVVAGFTDKVKQQIMGDTAFIGRIKEVFGDKQKVEGLKKDISTLKGVGNFYFRQLPADMVQVLRDKITISETGESGTEDGTIAENIITENIITHAIHTALEKINSVPPFSYLAKIAEYSTDLANLGVRGLSQLTVNLGGNAFDLPTIAFVLGIYAEYSLKGGLASLVGLKDPESWLMGSMPALATLLKVTYHVATIIALAEVAMAVTGQLAHDGEHAGHEGGHAAQPA